MSDRAGGEGFSLFDHLGVGDDMTTMPAAEEMAIGRSINGFARAMVALRIFFGSDWLGDAIAGTAD